MDGKDKQEGEPKTKIEFVKSIIEFAKSIFDFIKIVIIIVVLIIAARLYVAKEGGTYVLEEKHEGEQQQEEKKRPQMEARIGNTVCYGNEKYQVIHISNTNADAGIKGGILVVEYRIRGRHEDIDINCYLDGAIYEERVEYITEQDGGIVLLRNDYQKFPETIKACLEEQGINVTGEKIWEPYLLIYYKYTCGEENLEGYYKINIEEYGFGAVEEIDDPENYFEVYGIEI